MEAAVLLVLHDVFDGVFCSGGAGSRGPDGAARDGHGRDGAPEVHQWTFLSARAALKGAGIETRREEQNRNRLSNNRMRPRDVP